MFVSHHRTEHNLTNRNMVSISSRRTRHARIRTHIPVKHNRAYFVSVTPDKKGKERKKMKSVMHLTLYYFVLGFRTFFLPFSFEDLPSRPQKLYFLLNTKVSSYDSFISKRKPSLLTFSGIRTTILHKATS